MPSHRWRRFGSYTLAFAIALAALGWVASGEVLDEGEPEARKPPAPAVAALDIPEVRVREQSAEPHQRVASIRGRTQAARSVVVRAETAGRVVELMVDKGEDVEAGQILARIDPRDRPAQLAEAQARLEQRRIELEASENLSEKGFRAQTQLAEARAAFEEAQAAVRRAEIAMENTAIRAPFAGRVGERMIELGDYVGESSEIARIVDFDPIKIVGHVSERTVAEIAHGTPARARIISGREVEGRVTFVSREADVDTRTFRIEVEAANPDARIADGMTAHITIPVNQSMAHFIPPSVLTLSDDGILGVKIVDERNVVQFQPVDILDEQVEGVWVGGLPERATLITVGQEFVSPGNEVAPVAEDSIARSADSGSRASPESGAGASALQEALR